MRLNLADANGEEFTAEAMVLTNQGPLPEDIWASETNLTEVWEHPDEGWPPGVLKHLSLTEALYIYEATMGLQSRYPTHTTPPQPIACLSRSQKLLNQGAPGQ
ncbi:hypothetical protein CROQUDRAFT_100080 [Cronartium quercuum f. sp. fusiforme G11]|uniref:Uncharacterized protein n=1 Tax=Cronartium quercuum f. sp. fusiforme G11 TaxID=708437 RepID=A0A9P6N6F8_9BASI|nr:hypothetical protein CROQUDRAFT_100080 [Cronartium quercuum f. sp. fusiforme G11]